MIFDMGEGLNMSLLVVDRERMRATSKSRSWSLADRYPERKCRPQTCRLKELGFAKNLNESRSGFFP